MHVLDYVSKDGIFEIMKMITDVMFKNESIMAEILLSEDGFNNNLRVSEIEEEVGEEGDQSMMD